MSPYILTILGLLPSLAWLTFFLHEDIHPEPKKMIVKVFIFGSAITIFVLAFQYAVQDVLLELKIGDRDFVYLLFMASVEEIFKFFAAFMIIKRSRFFDEPIDAMIYIIVAALGLAMVENIAVMLQMETITEAVSVSMFRFVGATLLHALCSGLVGYYWALGIVKKMKKELITLGIVLASVLHALFNYFIIIFKEAMIYPIVFLIIIAFLVFWDFERLKEKDIESTSIVES